MESKKSTLKCISLLSSVAYDRFEEPNSSFTLQSHTHTWLSRFAFFELLVSYCCESVVLSFTVHTQSVDLR